MSKKIEEFIEDTADVVKQINRFNNAMTIGKNGKDLNKVINVLTGSSLSKFSASLGFLGATFSVISLFSSGKSTDQIILDMLGDLGDKIDNLQSLMLGKFDHLEAVVKKVGANTTLASAFATIDSIQGTVDSFLGAKNTSKRTASLELIRQCKSMDLRTAASNIHQTVKDGDLYNNIYDANLNSTYGDSVTIQNIGITLNYYLNVAKLLSDFLDCLNKIPYEKWNSIEIKEGQNPLDLVPDEYLPDFESASELNTEFYANYISHNESKWLKTLRESNNKCGDFIDSFLQQTVFPNVSAKEHKEAVNNIVSELKSKWGWLDFFAVVYDDVKGYSRHAMNGMYNGYHNYFRQSVKKGKVNIVVAWVDKDMPEKGATRNTKVSHNYTVTRGTPIPGGGFSTRVIHKNYTGKAEEYKNWKSLSYILDELVDNPPNSRRFVWVAKKKEGVSRAQTNKKRLNWVNGKYLDIAIWE